MESKIEADIIKRNSGRYNVSVGGVEIAEFGIRELGEHLLLTERMVLGALRVSSEGMCDEKVFWVSDLPFDENVDGRLYDQAKGYCESLVSLGRIGKFIDLDR